MPEIYNEELIRLRQRNRELLNLFMNERTKPIVFRDINQMGWCIVCTLLSRNGIVSRESLCTVAFNKKRYYEQPVSENAYLNVIVYRTNKILCEAGVSIKTDKSFGYYFTPEDKAKLLAIINNEVQQA